MQGLRIGVCRNKFNTSQPTAYHVINRVTTATTDAYDFNHGR
jgi:hypothetical protein